MAYSSRDSLCHRKERVTIPTGIAGADFVSKNRVLATGGVLHEGDRKSCLTSEKSFIPPSMP